MRQPKAWGRTNPSPPAPLSPQGERGTTRATPGRGPRKTRRRSSAAHDAADEPAAAQQFSRVAEHRRLVRSLLFVASLFGELIANDRPLITRARYLFRSLFNYTRQSSRSEARAEHVRGSFVADGGPNALIGIRTHPVSPIRPPSSIRQPRSNAADLDEDASAARWRSRAPRMWRRSCRLEPLWLGSDETGATPSTASSRSCSA